MRLFEDSISVYLLKKITFLRKLSIVVNFVVIRIFPIFPDAFSAKDVDSYSQGMNSYYGKRYDSLRWSKYKEYK